LTSDKNFFIISFLCCKQRGAGESGAAKWQAVRSTEFGSTAL